MRFVQDRDLSLCLTISQGIKRDELLDILGRVEQLPEPHAFDNFPWNSSQGGRKGILHVIEDNGFLVTLENQGFFGVTFRVSRKVASLPGEVHYIALRFSKDNYQYVEVQDGEVLATFDPAHDEMPEKVNHLFPEDNDPRSWMIQAAQWRLEDEVTIKPEWLETPTDTYVIDYRVRH